MGACLLGSMLLLGTMQYVLLQEQSMGSYFYKCSSLCLRVWNAPESAYASTAGSAMKTCNDHHTFATFTCHLIIAFLNEQVCIDG